MITNKDLRVEDGNLIINGEKHPLDPAVIALTKRANIVQGKFSALDTKLDAIEALEKTASGNPISITGVAGAYAISNIMSIEPTQSGSGDPSPTNVRPISGISTASIQTTNGEDTNTATITLGQTVYGGSVNFKTGEVTVNRGCGKIKDFNWLNGSTNKFYCAPSNCKSDTEIISSIYPYCESQAVSGNPSTDKAIGHWGAQLVVMDTSYNNASNFVSAMGEEEVCYELATPTTLTLTPAELELLKGNNTVSGNGANINLSYIGR